MRSVQKKVIQNDSCCLCGQKKCSQSVDHNYLSFYQFKRMIEKAKLPNKTLEQIRHNIRNFYHGLRYQIQCMIDKEQAMLEQYINKFYYSYLNDNGQNLSNDIYQYVSGNFDKLPSKNLSKVLQNIEKFNKKINSHSTSNPSNGKILQLKYQIQKFYKDFGRHKIVQKIKNVLLYKNIVQKPQATSKMPEVLLLSPTRLKKTCSQTSNPQQLHSPVNDCYKWKNCQIKPQTEVIQLNNKNIKDEQLIKQMPKIASFKNVQQFQIRNNRITAFSCKVLASNLFHIKKLDIRGNKIGDEGVLIIVKSLSQLKDLLISETGCTNVALKGVLEGLPGIQKFWCDQNSIDERYVLQVAKMPNLRMLSFAKCNLTPKLVQELKRLFNQKGYLSI